MNLRKRGTLLVPGGRCVWVGHRPGQARLWMGVGAIVTFGSISGSVSSDEYKDRFASWHWCDGLWRPGIPTGGVL